MKHAVLTMTLQQSCMMQRHITASVILWINNALDFALENSIYNI